MQKRDTYQEITNRIVSAIEAGGVAPWQRPWALSGGYPISLSTGKHYRGINVLLLMLEGRADPRWGTYKAIAAAGGQVRKGQKATNVVFWKRVERKRDIREGEDANYWLLRNFSVFNATQADGLPALPEKVERAFTPIETCEAIAKGYVWDGGTSGISDTDKRPVGPLVAHGGDRAAYSIDRDRVLMPEPPQFVTDEAYYTTLFHELIHSSGAEKRLNRLDRSTFGSDKYGQEELVAEMGAAFLAGIAGLESAGGDESAAYVGGWLDKIKGNPKMVVQAAAKAQRATDYILGTQFEEEATETTDESAHADSEQLVAA